MVPECHIQLEVKYLQGRRVSEQLVLGVTSLIVDKLFMLKWHFLDATVCPLPSEWAPLRRVFVFFTFSRQVLMRMDKILPDPSLLESRTVPALPAYSVSDTPILYGPLLDSFQYFHVSLVLWSPALESLATGTVLWPPSTLCIRK